MAHSNDDRRRRRCRSTRAACTCRGPAIAFVVGCSPLHALGVRHRLRPRGRRPAPPAEDGLLTLIATLSRRESALALRAVLSDAGIRSTIRVPAPHRADVLVFPEDADRARALAATFPGELSQPGRSVRSTFAPRPRSCSTKSG